MSGREALDDLVELFPADPLVSLMAAIQGRLQGLAGDKKISAARLRAELDEVARWIEDRSQDLLGMAAGVQEGLGGAGNVVVH